MQAFEFIFKNITVIERYKFNFGIKLNNNKTKPKTKIR